MRLLATLIICVCFTFVRCAVLAQDSVIVFAADALAASLTSANRFVLQSLYSAERADVDAADTHAVYAALSTSRRLREPAWQARVEREFARRASFVVDGAVECAQRGEANATAFAGAAFLGASVFLDSTAYVDVNCDARFTAGTDLPLTALGNTNTTTTAALNATTGVGTANTTVLIIPLEIVQSTFDVRLKRLITLVPIARNGTDTGLFFQPGLAAAFLPMLAAFQPASTTELLGEAVYPAQGNSESQVSRIVAFAELCTNGATATRFNAAAVDLRYALGTNENGTVAAAVVNATGGAIGAMQFGQCSIAAVRQALVNDTRANLLAGIFFVDANSDGIRNPRELTTSIPGVGAVALVNGTTANGFLELDQNADGTLLGAISDTAVTTGGFRNISTAGGGGAQFRALATLPAGADVATVGAEIIAGRQIKDASGSISVPTLCGAVDSRMSVSDRITSFGSGALISNDSLAGGMFLNQAVRDLSGVGIDARLLGAATVPVFRQPNNNIGFVCDRKAVQGRITVVAHCDNATLAADQLEIIDTYTVTIPNNVPAYQTWLATVTARAVANAPIDNRTIFDVLPMSIGTNAADFFQNAVTNVTDTGPTLRIDITSVDIADRDTNPGLDRTFEIVVITAYARTAAGLNCSGFPGEEIVSELVLTDIDASFPADQIGAFGGVCRHAQPAECVGGGVGNNATGAPTPLPPGSLLGSAPDGTLPIVLIFAGVGLVLIFAMVAVAAQ